jgi:rare lipoprotein A (peptidoglycan hydrolase)
MYNKLKAWGRRQKMRRVILTILTILGLLFTIGSCVTQGQGQPKEQSQLDKQRQPFQITQRGMATQENNEEGLTACHPALPIGSKARVTNIANGKEIEVTITGRISPSNTRIVDLSPGAAKALDIGFGGPVIINQIRATRVRAEPPPVMIVEAPPPPLPQSGFPTQEIQRQPLIQLGMATQENTDEGLTIRHPTLPIGSKAKVTNIANGKEIEVTITGRISPSPNRVTDLSPSTALALDIGKGGPVIIKMSTPQQR